MPIKRKKRRSKAVRPTGRIQPNRIDPTRTITLRRRFVAELRKRFALIRGAIVQMLVKDDAFDIKGRTAWDVTVRNVFCPTGEGGGVDPSCSPGMTGASYTPPAGSITRLTTTLYRASSVKDSTLEDARAGHDAIGSGVYFAEDENSVKGYGDHITKATVDGSFLEVNGDKDFNAIVKEAKSWAEAAVKKHIADAAIGRVKMDPQLIADMSHTPSLIRSYLESKGIDGIRYKQVDKTNDHHSQVLVFRPSKVRVENVFCATGEGGGVDPSCGSSGATVSEPRENGNWVYLHVIDKDGSTQSGGKPHGSMELSLKDGSYQVREVNVREHMRGQKLGIAMYEKAIALALKNGKGFHSDSATSDSADQVWRALERRGYAVERKPAELDKSLNKWYAVKEFKLPDGKSVSIRSGEPVWSLRTKITNAFCPTGEGGGIDPSCGGGHSGGLAKASAQIVDVAKKLGGSQWDAVRIADIRDELGESYTHEDVTAALWKLHDDGKVHMVHADDPRDETERDRIIPTARGFPSGQSKYKLYVTNVFCPTGDGGGIDPTCSKVYTGQPAKLEEIPQTERNELPFGYAFFTTDESVAKLYAGTHSNEVEGKSDYSLGRRGEVYTAKLHIKNPMNLDKFDEDEWVRHILDKSGDNDFEYTYTDLAEAIGLKADVEFDEETRRRLIIGWVTPGGRYIQKRFELEDVASKLWKEQAGSGVTLQDALSESTSGQLSVLFPDAGARYARKHGYDGYVFRDAEMGGTTIVPFTKDQIEILKGADDGTRRTANRAGADAQRGGRSDPGPSVGPTRVGNVFCATGEGGGVDPTCGEGGAKAVETYKQGGGLGVLYNPPKQGYGEPSSEVSDTGYEKRVAMLERVYGDGRNGERDGFPSDHGHEDSVYDELAKIAYDVVRSSTANTTELGPMWNQTHKSFAIWQGDYGEKVAIYSGKRKGITGYKLEGISDVFISATSTREQMALAVHRAMKLKPPAKLTGKGVTNADPRYQFKSSSEQLKAFQEWLAELYGEHLSIKQLMKRYAEDGYKRGIGRAFNDVEKPQMLETIGASYIPSREQFLRAAFGSPIGQERVEQLASRSFDDLQNVTGDMAARMSRTLLDGLVSGAHPMAIAKGMSKDMDISLGRAETIARTEIIRAHAEGQLDAMEAMGMSQVGVQVEWSTARDDAVCPRCEVMEGIVLDLDKAHGLIPFHPNCRCAFIPAGEPLEIKTVKQAAEDGFDPTENRRRKGRSWLDVVNVFCEE